MFSFVYIILICFSLGKTQSNGSRLKLDVTNETTISDHEDGTTPEKCFYDCYDKPNITYEVDATIGKMTALFPLPPFCNHTNYHITLKVDENLKNDECSGDLPNSIDRSKKDFIPKQDMNGSSEVNESNKYGKVEFDCINSGCYKLVILPKVNESTNQELNSCAMYIQTNIPKKVIPDDGVLINPAYFSEKNQFKVNIMPNFTFESMKIELTLVEKSTEPTKLTELAESIQLAKSTKLAESTVSANLTKSICPRYGTYHSRCTLDSNCNSTESVKPPHCSRVNREIRCIFYDVLPGFYCIKVELTDDCCEHLDLNVNHRCLWRKLVVANEEHFHDVSQQSHFVYSLAVIIVIIIACFAGVIIWLMKRRSLWIPPPEEPPDEIIIPMIQKKKVLLLYPRDCKHFMDTMKTFGKLLEKSHNVEQVFDCFNNEDVLDGPLAWVHRLTSNPKICTIIVTNHCAYIQQEAIKAGYSVTSHRLYKEPSYLDAIFIYGLKSIMEDLSPNINRKVYVIGFNGFSNDDYMLSLPTSFTRYIIPDHLLTLLSDMNVISHSESYHLKHTVEYVTLLSNIKSIKEYKLKYPRYLEDILNFM